MILLVDDEIFILEMLSRKLRGKGYTVTQAATLDAARMLCSQGEKPAVVVSDIHMPDGNGLDFLKWVMETVPTAKRIVLSAHIYEEDVEDAVKKGIVHEALSKPLNMDMLISAIE